MKIRSEQFEALQQQEETRKRSSGSSDAFGELFARELEQQESAGKAQTTSPMPGVRGLVLDPMLMMAQVEQTGAVEAVEQVAGDSAAAVVERVDGMLDKWEQYSRQIGAEEEADLKGASATLEDISGDLTQLREQNPDLAEQHPGLGSVVNELEVMSFTERFKMNRGDYV